MYHSTNAKETLEYWRNRVMTIIDTDYNLDSRGMIDVLTGIAGGMLLNSSGMPMGQSNDDYFNYQLTSLDNKQLNTLFRRSFLLRKVVTLFPKDAASAGYIVKDESDKIIATTDTLVIRAFEETSMNARLYGKAHCILESEKSSLLSPLSNDLIMGYKVKIKLKRKGDYYFTDKDVKYAHKSRVFTFIGVRTFVEDTEIDDDEYSESVLTGLLVSVKDFLVSSQYGRKILKNLSNLTIGMKGLGMHLKSNKGKAQISERMIAFDMNRNLDNAIAYDLENEKVEYVTQSLAQVPEFLSELKTVFVSNTEYPMDKLFNESTRSGLSSGYQNQLIVRFQWAEQVKRWSELNYHPHLNRLYNSLTPESKLKIEIPLPLSLTDQEIAEVEEKTANKLVSLKNAGIITADEARNSYKGKVVNLNVILNDETVIENEVTNNETDNETNNNKDSVSDFFWETLSNITLEDLDKLAVEVLEEIK